MKHCPTNKQIKKWKREKEKLQEECDLIGSFCPIFSRLLPGSRGKATVSL